jgi:hypothetical protein
MPATKPGIKGGSSKRGQSLDIDPWDGKPRFLACFQAF